MCKVLVIPKITDKTRTSALRFVKEMSVSMSWGNSDGLGYAAVNKDGDLFGERWLTNGDSFPSLPRPLQVDLTQDVFGSVLTYKNTTSSPSLSTSKEGEVIHNSFGSVDLNTMTAITMHTRMATSSKGQENTHPFVDAQYDTSLIHNGIINNTEDFKFTLSSCDSEAILISYLQNQVNLDVIAHANKMTSELVGYYVAAMFSRNAQGVRILDLFKVHNSNLYVSWVTELESFVFASAEHNIKSICESLKFTFTEPRQVKDGSFIRMYPNTEEAPWLISINEGSRYVSTVTPSYQGAKHVPTPTASKPDPESCPVVQLPTNKKKGGMSANMIEYMKSPTSLRRLEDREAAEELRNYHYRN